MPYIHYKRYIDTEGACNCTLSCQGGHLPLAKRVRGRQTIIKHAKKQYIHDMEQTRLRELAVAPAAPFTVVKAPPRLPSPERSMLGFPQAVAGEGNAFNDYSMPAGVGEYSGDEGFQRESVRPV